MLKTLVTALTLTSAVSAAPHWGSWKHQPCTPENAQVRQDFDTMVPADRKAFTDAINCLRSKPSNLNQTEFPAAINRYFDWAVLHVQSTPYVHLDGFFLAWHRLYIHLFQKDLKEQCGYKGAMPYWNWPATADNLTGSNIFNGDEYSMSGDGAFTNNEPYALAPGFAIPHGSGGGCLKSGPFKDMSYTMPPIDIGYLINGSGVPANAFEKHESCLTRDLNTFAAQTWCNTTAVELAVESPSRGAFDVALNGVFGGTALGIHSGAHFIVGPPGSNIFVSAQDPIWYPLHTMLDRTYVSWQARHPTMANDTVGTMTAVNLPPSANVTLDSVVPGFGYFDGGKTWTMRDLVSTTAGPFCYVYDTLI